MAATSLSYDYEAIDGAPTAGKAQQGVANPAQLTISYTGQGATNNTTFLQSLNNTYTITCNGLTWTISAVKQQVSSVIVTINPAEAALPYGITNLVFNVEATTELPTFPAFTPIVPPPLFGVGGGPPPTFPPPTPPPIGSVPVGVLVGPAIAAAAVPPSTAGFPLVRYATGSATVPAANGYFTQFTTAPYTGFPNQPPAGVPIVFSNILTMPTFAAGVWTTHPPPSTATTAVVPSGHSLMAEGVPQSLSAAAVVNHHTTRSRRHRRHLEA